MIDHEGHESHEIDHEDHEGHEIINIKEWTIIKSNQLNYKGTILKHVFECDFVCYDKIIVEIKAVHELDDMHKSQIINYLHYSGLHLGLLINFGENRLVSKRFIV